jgi:hypothetical protein
MATETAQPDTEHGAADAARRAELGYKQELRRASW